MPAAGTNRYPAICGKCGGRVEAGEGTLVSRVGGRWVVIHLTCQEARTTAASAPEPQPSPYQDLAINYSNIYEGWHLGVTYQGREFAHPAVWLSEKEACDFLTKIKGNLDKVNLDNWIDPTKKNGITFYCMEEEAF